MPKPKELNSPLADVNVLDPKDPKRTDLKKDEEHEIVIHFSPDPQLIWGEANAKAALAIDASKSMKPSFGFGGPFGGDPNYVELVSRKIGYILSGITKNGKSSAMYWALDLGDGTEDLGEFDSNEWNQASFGGPKSNQRWGRGTHILPTIKHFAENIFPKAEAFMGVIITDGIIEDEQAATDYCMELGRKLVEEKKTDKFKLVLIGAGEYIDVEQLSRFDDMFEDTDLKDEVDIWDHGVAPSMKDEQQILDALFGELMDKDTIVAETGSVEDEHGNVIKSFADGLPGEFRFILPAGNTKFTIKTPKGEVTQEISDVLS